MAGAWAGSILVLALGATAGGADRYAFTVQSAASGLDLTVDASAPATGTLIGDYDAASNPAGTRTKPGVFGTFGATENVAVPLMVTGVIAGDAATHPTGTFTLAMDAAAGTVAVTGLSLNLLGAGGPPTAITASANMQWSTFRERSPTCILPGGITIPVPLGSATLTTFALAQTDPSVPAAGTLVPAPGGEAGVFTLAVAVPATVTTEVAIAGQAGTGPQTQQATAALAGTLTVAAGGETATLALTLDGFSVDQTVPGPLGNPTDLPFTEPVCQGNLIFTLQLQSLSVGLDAAASLSALGTRLAPPPCPCDFNRINGLTAQDIYDYITAFVQSDPRTDFNGTGGVTVQDLYDFLECWWRGVGGAGAAGC